VKGIGKVPKGAVRQIIRENTESYALDEESDSSSSYSGVEYVDKGVTADLYLHSPENMSEIVLSGEQDTGSLQGVCLPEDDGTAPVDEHDRLNYGQKRYEIEEAIPYPSVNNPDIYELVLTRVVEGGV